MGLRCDKVIARGTGVAYPFFPFNGKNRAGYGSRGKPMLAKPHFRDHFLYVATPLHTGIARLSKNRSDHG